MSALPLTGEIQLWRECRWEGEDACLRLVFSCPAGVPPPRPAATSGYLRKYGKGLIKGWKTRFFQLIENNVYYSKDESSESISYIPLAKSKVYEDGAAATKDGYIFSIEVHDRVYRLAAYTANDRARWVRALKYSALYTQTKGAGPFPSDVLPIVECEVPILGIVEAKVPQAFEWPAEVAKEVQGEESVFTVRTDTEYHVLIAKTNAKAKNWATGVAHWTTKVKTKTPLTARAVGATLDFRPGSASQAGAGTVLIGPDDRSELDSVLSGSSSESNSGFVNPLYNSTLTVDEDGLDKDWASHGDSIPIDIGAGLGDDDDRNNLPEVLVWDGGAHLVVDDRVYATARALVRVCDSEDWDYIAAAMLNHLLALLDTQIAVLPNVCPLHPAVSAVSVKTEQIRDRLASTAASSDDLVDLRCVLEDLLLLVADWQTVKDAGKSVLRSAIHIRDARRYTEEFVPSLDDLTPVCSRLVAVLLQRAAFLQCFVDNIEMLASRLDDAATTLVSTTVKCFATPGDRSARASQIVAAQSLSTIVGQMVAVIGPKVDTLAQAVSETQFAQLEAKAMQHTQAGVCWGRVTESFTGPDDEVIPAGAICTHVHRSRSRRAWVRACVHGCVIELPDDVIEFGGADEAPPGSEPGAARRVIVTRGGLESVQTVKGGRKENGEGGTDSERDLYMFDAAVASLASSAAATSTANSPYPDS